MSVEYHRPEWLRFARRKPIERKATSSSTKDALVAVGRALTLKKHRLVLVILCVATVMVATGVARAYDV